MQIENYTLKFIIIRSLNENQNRGMFAIEFQDMQKKERFVQNESKIVLEGYENTPFKAEFHPDNRFLAVIRLPIIKGEKEKLTIAKDLREKLISYLKQKYYPTYRGSLNVETEVHIPNHLASPLMDTVIDKSNALKKEEIKAPLVPVSGDLNKSERERVYFSQRVEMQKRQDAEYQLDLGIRHKILSTLSKFYKRPTQFPKTVSGIGGGVAFGIGYAFFAITAFYLALITTLAALTLFGAMHIRNRVYKEAYHSILDKLYEQLTNKSSQNNSKTENITNVTISSITGNPEEDDTILRGIKARQDWKYYLVSWGDYRNYAPKDLKNFGAGMQFTSDEAELVRSKVKPVKV